MAPAGPVDLIGLGTVEIEHDAHDVGTELGVAEIGDAAPVHAVVDRRGGLAEARADDIEDQAVGRR